MNEMNERRALVCARRVWRVRAAAVGNSIVNSNAHDNRVANVPRHILLRASVISLVLTVGQRDERAVAPARPSGSTAKANGGAKGESEIKSSVNRLGAPAPRPTEFTFDDSRSDALTRRGRVIAAAVPTAWRCRSSSALCSAQTATSHD